MSDDIKEIIEIINEMTPEEFQQAQREGLLDELTSGFSDEELDSWYKGMSPEKQQAFDSFDPEETQGVLPPIDERGDPTASAEMRHDVGLSIIDVEGPLKDHRMAVMNLANRTTIDALRKKFPNYEFEQDSTGRIVYGRVGSPSKFPFDPSRLESGDWKDILGDVGKTVAGYIGARVLGSAWGAKGLATAGPWGGLGGYAGGTIVGGAGGEGVADALLQYVGSQLGYNLGVEPSQVLLNMGVGGLTNSPLIPFFGGAPVTKKFRQDLISKNIEPRKIEDPIGTKMRSMTDWIQAHLMGGPTRQHRQTLRKQAPLMKEAEEKWENPAGGLADEIIEDATDILRQAKEKTGQEMETYLRSKKDLEEVKTPMGIVVNEVPPTVNLGKFAKELDKKIDEFSQPGYKEAMPEMHAELLDMRERYLSTGRLQHPLLVFRVNQDMKGLLKSNTKNLNSKERARQSVLKELNKHYQGALFDSLRKYAKEDEANFKHLYTRYAQINSLERNLASQGLLDPLEEGAGEVLGDAVDEALEGGGVSVMRSRGRQNLLDLDTKSGVQKREGLAKNLTILDNLADKMGLSKTIPGANEAADPVPFGSLMDRARGVAAFKYWGDPPDSPRIGGVGFGAGTGMFLSAMNNPESVFSHLLAGGAGALGSFWASPRFVKSRTMGADTYNRYWNPYLMHPLSRATARPRMEDAVGWVGEQMQPEMQMQARPLGAPAQPPLPSPYPAMTPGMRDYMNQGGR